MDGILNINKPEGMTSFDVVRKVRFMLKNEKVGHTGTLDPMASGVLPICVGRATKFADYMVESKKIYLAELRLGITTETYDREGSVVNTRGVYLKKKDIIEEILSFQGEIEQVPPMYSALKVNGRRLYELARKGIEIERKKRKITIYSIDIVNIELPYVSFKVTCSKGTYIRSLCNDIGNNLNCGGTMWNLKRLSTGNFNIADSIALEYLDSENILKYIIPIDKALYGYPEVLVEDEYVKKILNGISIKDESFLSKTIKDKLYRVYIEGNKFIGIGMNKDFQFKMVKLFV
ncbi:tRNA pseudouridine(55) synthase TruB [Clostridium kluyveri]|uniref:tRNA pseudouridine synthase B n=2 Tax=Clostridium kluyveri TaxID=1534 RepID=TRUB_CLOK5|nr:tRNA pseudouridine(55) synthase TruB [Clostridium kluyveri]A5N845.1 RecName: Full=tRNA pseudouridine synthase B; AltName: Full=tRNA pseudouridine(55) synthase; Short=Psi55 synthase; AltName: Full=tRNA pseudouridylate synthase; AltName: Full=tRNA-uridine isomerase [Clostridium kluyveri DSM 555]EDK33476.1 TruB [Clostridium kluyveri DSM 555]